MAKINFKKGLTDIVLYIIIFIVVQIFLTCAGAGIWAAVKGEGYQATLLAMHTGNNAILTALTTVFSNVITLIIFLKAKWTPITRNYLQSKPWISLLWVALFTLGAIIPLEFVYEQIGIEMDADTERVFASLNENGDVVRAINEQITALKSGKLSRDEQVLSLKFLVHLMGDLHCPMHMGHMSDRGGNKWQVQFFRSGTSLPSQRSSSQWTRADKRDRPSRALSSLQDAAAA